VDDLNMQAPDDYGTQTTIELLRQIHDSGEVFDRENCQEKKRIADVLLFGCQNPKAGSFKIDLRLQRHFTVFAFMVPGADILTSVYGKIMNGHVSKFAGSPFKDLGDKYIKSLLSFYNQIMLDAVNFSPSGARFTYQFNLRELSKVVEGVL
jgi:dynein heavy chain